MAAINKSIIVFISFVIPLLAQAVEPPNIHFVKQQLAYYHDSGQYHNDQNRIACRARGCLQKQIKSFNNKKKLAIVLDIDDTALSLYDFRYKLEFGWNDRLFKKAVQKSNFKAIDPTLNLYNFAKRNGVAVFFVTARKENLRDATVKNLTTAGYKNWDGLYLCPDNKKHQTSSGFKEGVRSLLRSQGYYVVGNIGDQESDLAGSDHIQCKFKMPNPYVLIR